MATRRVETLLNADAPTSKVAGKLVQSGNIVHGHQAGRDVVVYNAAPSAMTTLIEQYEADVVAGTISKKIIEQLEHWTKPVSDETLAGLEPKLNAANREDEIHEAKVLKERITKHISKFQFSPGAQSIFAFALASAQTRFRHVVWPAILDNQPRTEVDSLILKEVIDPVLAQLEKNPLGLDSSLVRGLIYYLAGNCHIRWSK